MTVPFKATGKSPLHRLLDLLLEAPCILRQAETLSQSSSPEEQLLAARAILDKCQQLETRQLAFHAEFLTSIPAFISERTFKSNSSWAQSLYPIVYQFSDVQTAGLHMLYWASMIMLCNGICRLVPLVAYLSSQVDATAKLSQNNEELFEPSTTQSLEDSAVEYLFCDNLDEFLEQDSSLQATHRSAPLLPERPSDAHDILTYAQNVCKSVPYCFNQNETDIGISFATSSLHIVLVTLLSWGDVYKAECEWIRGTLEMIRQRSLGIVEFLEGVRD